MISGSEDWRDQRSGIRDEPPCNANGNGEWRYTFERFATLCAPRQSEIEIERETVRARLGTETETENRASHSSAPNRFVLLVPIPSVHLAFVHPLRTGATLSSHHIFKSHLFIFIGFFIPLAPGRIDSLKTNRREASVITTRQQVQKGQKGRVRLTTEQTGQTDDREKRGVGETRGKKG